MAFSWVIDGTSLSWSSAGYLFLRHLLCPRLLGCRWFYSFVLWRFIVVN